MMTVEPKLVPVRMDLLARSNGPIAGLPGSAACKYSRRQVRLATRPTGVARLNSDADTRRALDDDAALDDMPPATFALGLRRPVTSRESVQVRGSFSAVDERPGPTEVRTPGYTVLDAIAGADHHTRAGRVQAELGIIFVRARPVDPASRGRPRPGVSPQVPPDRAGCKGIFEARPVGHFDAPREAARGARVPSPAPPAQPPGIPLRGVRQALPQLFDETESFVQRKATDVDLWG